MAYALVDEPTPGRMASTTTDPMFPLLAVMLGGGLLGFGWFVWNALAVGSTTSRREIGIAAVAQVGLTVMRVAIFMALAAEIVTPGVVTYLIISTQVWKLAFGYWLFSLQAVPVGLHVYFGGQTLGSPWLFVGGAFLVRGALAGQIPLLAAVVL